MVHATRPALPAVLHQVVNPVFDANAASGSDGLGDLPAEVALVGLSADGPLGALRAGLDALEAEGGLRLPPDLDAALEEAETAVLAQGGRLLDRTKFGWGAMDLFRGRDAEARR